RVPCVDSQANSAQVAVYSNSKRGQVKFPVQIMDLSVSCRAALREPSASESIHVRKVRPALHFPEKHAQRGTTVGGATLGGATHLGTANLRLSSCVPPTSVRFLALTWAFISARPRRDRGRAAAAQRRASHQPPPPRPLGSFAQAREAPGSRRLHDGRGKVS